MQDAAEQEGAGKIISRLEAALSTDGDFPARARVINELLTLANNPDTPLERIVELVLSEPALGTRILHIVNSVLYQGATPVIT
ncbi:MAG TPA: HDOD domain-containing protein, partial [Oligoflexia bacterium]|nr:HDOD domain-containing protein [Oligoflexia bacterium]